MNLTPRGNNFMLTWIILGLIFGIQGLSSTSKALKMAIIGAGPSGLSSAKNALEQGHKVVIYEQAGELGGTWLYTDNTGYDEYGVYIHTAMYQGQRTNNPSQNMEFPGQKFPNNTSSWPPHEEMLKYLNSYADNFNVKKHIKFHHLVVKVHSIEKYKWKIIVKNLAENKTVSEIYDAVFVCNNVYSTPNYLQFEGADKFKGKIMHSHDYRRAEDFRGAAVLVIGGGPSGVDLILQLSNIANRVTWSRRSSKETEEVRKSYGKNVTFKNAVQRLTSNGAEFMDGTQQEFTVIICATGYLFSYPFLDADTSISVENNYVQPLYKQIINIEHPTMAFIAIPQISIPFLAIDLQVRFALKFFSGAKELPSKSEMLKDTQDFVENQKKKGHSKSKIHTIDLDYAKEYYGEVAQAADLAKISDVFFYTYIDAINHLYSDPIGFRNYKYIIIDDKTFKKEKEV